MNKRKPEQKHKQGQGLVEFALILPILLLTVLLFLSFAQLFNTWSGLQAAAVAGARQVSYTGSEAQVEQVVADSLQAHAVDPGDVSVTTTIRHADGSPKPCPGGPPCPVEFGDLVTVELAKPFEVHVLDWQAQGHLRGSHETRAQHGAWLP